MAIASSSVPKNDWQLAGKLLPYAKKNLITLVVSIVLLIPLAIAGAVQPLVVVRQFPYCGAKPCGASSPISAFQQGLTV